MAVQVGTLWAQGPWDMSWVVLAQGTEPLLSGCIGHWEAAGSPTCGRRECLRKAFVHSEPLNKLIKEKAGLPRGVVGEEEKRGIDYSVYSVGTQSTLSLQREMTEITVKRI